MNHELDGMISSGIIEDKIIEHAVEAINFPKSAEEVQEAERELDSMIHRWKAITTGAVVV